jgi:hypothetical protein
VTSNIALSDWAWYLGDATLIAAILDGPSYRQHVAQERAAGRAGNGVTRDRAPRSTTDGR